MEPHRGSEPSPNSDTAPCPGLVLQPLAARYPAARAGVRSGWETAQLGGPVRAMPVVLRLERRAGRVVALRSAVLEAAAAAALAVCVDSRAQPSGEWHDAVAAWVEGRIRKIVRRARGTHWAAVQELPGVTVDVDGAQVRALVPGPVDEVPKIVSRLQIGGTDLEPDDPGPPPPGASAIYLNPAVEMSLGKAAAQVGHASMLLAAVRGLDAVPRFAVRSASAQQWTELCAGVDRGDAVAVRDAGFTEVAPGTITCIAMMIAGSGRPRRPAQP